MSGSSDGPLGASGGLSRNVKWLLVVTVLLALFLRVWGIDFGLPYLYDPDEPYAIRIAQRMFVTGDLNPHFFHWPSLLFYVNTIALAPYYLVGKLAGVFQTPGDIPAPVLIDHALGVGWTSMPATWLLGRAISILFGLTNVVLVFLIGRELSGGTPVGLLAALMMATSPTNVIHSRLIIPDTLMVSFVLLSFLGSALVYRQGKTWHYLVAGAGCGLAASAKYNGGIAILSLVLAHSLRYGLKGMVKPALCWAILSSVVAFLVGMPYALLDYRGFLDGLLYDVAHYSGGHPGLEGDTLGWYWKYAWQNEGPVVVLAVAGLVRGFLGHSKRVLLLTSFPVVYFALIGGLVVRNARMTLPLIPFSFLLASYLLVELAERVHFGRLRRPLALSVGGALVLTLLALPLLRTVQDAVQLTAVDSRETARTWIDGHLPPGARVAVESYAPFVDPGRFSVQGFGKMIDHAPGWYAENGFEYLVFGEGRFGRFYREPNRYAGEVSQYEELFDAFQEVSVFTDGGYQVRVYRVEQQ